MDAVLTKPVEARILLEALDGIVSRHGRRTGLEPTQREQARGDIFPADMGAPIVVPHPRLQVVAEAPVDLHAIESLRALGGDDTFFTEIIADFISDGQTIIDSLALAVELGDIGNVRENAHALRSSAAHVGAMRLHSITRDLYDLRPDEVKAGGRVLVERLRKEFAIVCAALAEAVEAVRDADSDRLT